MANEFVARKGVISLGDIQVTGSISATGGITVSGSISSASFATSAATASSADNFFVRQNVTASNMLATGRITAQTLVVQTVTSSIVYSSGSNIFGNQLTDIQQLTGSVRVTGSFTVVTTNPELTVGTTGVTLGNVLTDVHQVTGSLRVTGSGTYSSTIAATQYTAQADNAYYRVRRAAGTDVGYIVDSTTWGDSGTDFSIGASSTNLRFYTNNVVTERMRIDSCGNVGIGYTPCTSYGPLQVKSPASSYTIDLVGRTAGLNGESQITFWNSGQTVVQGAIGNIARCMVFYAGGTEVMRMTCGGNLYIGTANDINTAANRTVLTVNGSSTAIINLATGGAQSAYWYHNGTDMLFVNGKNGAALFYTCDNERMRITSAGCVGIGNWSTNVPQDTLHVNGTIQVGFVNSLNSAMRLFWNGASSYGAIQTSSSSNLALNPSGNNVLIGGTTQAGYSGVVPRLELYGSNISSADGDGGNLVIYGSSNAANQGGGIALGSLFNSPNGYGTFARIRAVKANSNNGDVGGGLAFDTRPSAGSFTERMRIACNGAVYINTDSNQLANATPALGILAGTTCDAVNIKHLQNGNNSVNIWQTGTSAFGAIVFYKGNTQDERGNIIVSTTGTSFNSVSDYRLKENITPSSCGLDRLMQLKPSKFNWIQTGEEAEGFIAHELQEVFPYAVTGEKDGVYSNTGNIKPQSVDYGRITPLLVKAIQEQQCQICTQSIIIDQLKTCLGII